MAIVMGLLKNREVLIDSARLLSIVVGRIGAWNIGQFILATGEVGHF